jgi:hypothetical protein
MAAQFSPSLAWDDVLKYTARFRQAVQSWSRDVGGLTECPADDRAEMRLGFRLGLGRTPTEALFFLLGESSPPKNGNCGGGDDIVADRICGQKSLGTDKTMTTRKATGAPTFKGLLTDPLR